LAYKGEVTKLSKFGLQYTIVAEHLVDAGTAPEATVIAHGPRKQELKDAGWTIVNITVVGPYDDDQAEAIEAQLEDLKERI